MRVRPERPWLGPLDELQHLGHVGRTQFDHVGVDREAGLSRWAAAGPDHLPAFEDENRLPVRGRGRRAAEHVGELATPEEPGEVGPVRRARIRGHRREGRDIGQVRGGPAAPAGEIRVVTAQ
ncbi:hypothetical protein GCM10010246_08110 [Streptomyces cuspidosporus]|uniref:Uncharacterized protein n=1 Tax=Streptomyces cuspidosporus TaxID=66882 RepID=A0ABN3FDY1_9ACTN